MAQALNSLSQLKLLVHQKPHGVGEAGELFGVKCSTTLCSSNVRLIFQNGGSSEPEYMRKLFIGGLDYKTTEATLKVGWRGSSEAPA